VVGAVADHCRLRLARQRCDAGVPRRSGWLRHGLARRGTWWLFISMHATAGCRGARGAAVRAERALSLYLALAMADLRALAQRRGWRRRAAVRRAGCWPNSRAA
jgi:hypothetical protein